jgi:hypothetical protein
MQIMKLLIMRPPPVPFYLIPLRPKYPPQHVTLTPCAYVPHLNMTDQVSHPNKTGKFIVMYIWICIFLDSKQEDKRFCTKW